MTREVGLVLAALVAAAGCRTTEPRTQVVVRISAQPAVAAGAATLEVRVSGGPAGMLAERTVQTVGSVSVPVRFPITTAIAPVDRDSSRVFELTATARSASGEVLGRVRATSGFVAQRTLALELSMEDCCRGVASTCSAGQTCRGCACVDARVDPQSLPPLLDGGVPDTGGLDASALDASGRTDLGVIDAAPMDAERPDFGAQDAGAADATLDLGAADAGPCAGPWEPRAVLGATAASSVAVVPDGTDAVAAWIDASGNLSIGRLDAARVSMTGMRSVIPQTRAPRSPRLAASTTGFVLAYVANDAACITELTMALTSARAEQCVPGSAVFAGTPIDLAVGPMGPVAVWSDTVNGGSVVVARFTPGSISFGPIAGMEGASSPHIARGSSGFLVVYAFDNGGGQTAFSIPINDMGGQSGMRVMQGQPDNQFILGLVSLGSEYVLARAYYAAATFTVELTRIPETGAADSLGSFPGNGSILEGALFALPGRRGVAVATITSTGLTVQEVSPLGMRLRSTQLTGTAQLIPTFAPNSIAYDVFTSAGGPREITRLRAPCF